MAYAISFDQSLHIKMIIYTLIQIWISLDGLSKMKAAEDLQKGIQQLVDLTKQDDVSNPNSLQLIKMPQLALIMSKYFVSLSKLCLTHYHSYAKNIKRSEKGDGSWKGRQQFDIFRNPPKKPLTAYILYFQDRVPPFQQQHPKLTIGDLTRLIAKQWKELSEQKKKPYIDRAEQGKKKYDNEKRDFQLNKMKKIDLQGNNRNINESEQNSEPDNKIKNNSEEAEEEDVQDGI